MDTKKTDLNRRRFLLAAGAGSAGVVVMATRAGREAPASTRDGSVDEAAGRGGYRDSGHVRNYYRTTRI